MDLQGGWLLQQQQQQPLQQKSREGGGPGLLKLRQWMQGQVWMYVRKTSPCPALLAQCGPAMLLRVMALLLPAVSLLLLLLLRHAAVLLPAGLLRVLLHLLALLSGGQQVAT